MFGENPGKICKKFSGKLKHEDFNGKLSFSNQGIFFEFSAKYQITPLVYALQVPLGVISNFRDANNPLEALLATSKKRLFSVTFYVVQYCMILSQNSDYFSLVAGTIDTG